MRNKADAPQDGTLRYKTDGETRFSFILFSPFSPFLLLLEIGTVASCVTSLAVESKACPVQHEYSLYFYLHIILNLS
ncbi:hypothetical protein PAHAL_7G164900 [Panicum hallii]|uniref:Uncharacterized protein n=1 Tax=Panicum hallii TaxID=206008 RepID=A0A2T8ICG5_9POAL|nr:hypothetical protein PAHAL_7G164900 [Panicum hallii]